MYSDAQSILTVAFEATFILGLLYIALGAISFTATKIQASTASDTSTPEVTTDADTAVNEQPQADQVPVPVFLPVAQVPPTISQRSLEAFVLRHLPPARPVIEIDSTGIAADPRPDQPKPAPKPLLMLPSVSTGTELTLRELRRIASEVGLSRYSRKSKAQIIAELAGVPSFA